MIKKHNLTALAIGSLVLLLPALALAAGDGSGGGAVDIDSKSLLGWYIAALGWGLVTSLTPCVYPMIPITLAVFGARDKDTSRGKAFLL
ncbi:MAG: hypothetical protein AAGC55_30035, partial [Myxococcota bacterium]